MCEYIRISNVDETAGSSTCSYCSLSLYPLFEPRSSLLRLSFVLNELTLCEDKISSMDGAIAVDVCASIVELVVRCYGFSMYVFRHLGTGKGHISM